MAIIRPVMCECRRVFPTRFAQPELRNSVECPDCHRDIVFGPLQAFHDRMDFTNGMAAGPVQEAHCSLL